MNVLVINGSPRVEAGNTQAILTPFLVGVRESGAKVEIINLARKKIKSCIGCFQCYAKSPGVCIHDDDMPAIQDRLSSSDILVLATPLYIDGMTGLCKVFVDRLVTFLDPHFLVEGSRVYHPLRRKFPGRMFLVSVCGYPGLHNFDPLVEHFKRVCLNMGSDYCGALLRPAAFSLLLGKKYPELLKNVLDAARAIGRSLIETGSVDQDMAKLVAQDICSTDELVRMANAFWDRELSTTNDD